jgi:hypothetical protein
MSSNSITEKSDMFVVSFAKALGVNESTVGRVAAGSLAT